ncbi:MAG: hypothetical protein IH991_00975 [Planctomycetes bacterium]|nr:hypothetical protein [Planctomycetota bacterium]
MKSPTDTRRVATWQFSIRSLILAIVFISFILAWIRWFWTDYGLAAYYPGFYGICSVGVLLMAWFQLRNASGCPSVWNLIALAWFVSIGNLFYSILLAFNSISAESADTLARLRQDGVYLSIVSAITLPLFFTVPGLYVLVFLYRSRPKPITCFIYCSLALVIVDAFLFCTLVSLTFGTLGR